MSGAHHGSCSECPGPLSLPVLFQNKQRLILGEIWARPLCTCCALFDLSDGLIYISINYGKLIYFGKLRSRPNLVRETWKRIFFSTVRSIVHINPPREIKTITLSKTELFVNTHQTGRIWKRRLWVLVWVETFVNEAAEVQKRWRHDNHVISLPEFSSNTNPKRQVIVACLNFTGVEWKEIIWCVSRVKTPI